MVGNPTKIFIVEDDSIYNKMITYILENEEDNDIYSFRTGKDCINNMEKDPQIVIIDYSLPDMDGFEVFQKISNINSKTKVIILFSYSEPGVAGNLLNAGVYDYIHKGSETKDILLNVVKNLKEKIKIEKELIQLRKEIKGYYLNDQFLVGKSDLIKNTNNLIEKAATSEITVSLTGDIGSGKEFVAKSIHYNSSRSDGPFIVVNIGSIPNHQQELELFGIEKGASSETHFSKRGYLELSDQGTIYLDEISELDINIQIKMLRAIQEKEIFRIGSERPIPFDSRIIVSSNKDLMEEVRKHTFREDLFYSLLGLSIHIPPLSSRGDDVLLLAKNILVKFCNSNNVGEKYFTNGALEKLMRYDYPGNVRELEAAIELGAVLSNGQKITEENIVFSREIKSTGFLNEEMSMQQYKERIIKHYLDKYNNDISRVASSLKIGQSTLYRLIKEFKQNKPT